METSDDLVIPEDCGGLDKRAGLERRRFAGAQVLQEIEVRRLRREGGHIVPKIGCRFSENLLRLIYYLRVRCYLKNLKNLKWLSKNV